MPVWRCSYDRVMCWTWILIVSWAGWRDVVTNTGGWLGWRAGAAHSVQVLNQHALRCTFGSAKASSTWTNLNSLFVVCRSANLTRDSMFVVAVTELELDDSCLPSIRTKFKIPGKFAIGSMVYKLLHCCIGTHARVHIHFLRRSLLRCLEN